MGIQSLIDKKIKVRDLVVRIAENQLEIEKALRLRYEVFNMELQEGLPESKSTGKDRDEYDIFCDHLLVIDRANQDKVVGTYRILRKTIAKKCIGFYSETEFDLLNIYNLTDEVAEVGRSCVHPEYRDGSVISLLWAGLAKYMTEFDVRYYMGCGSIHSTDVVKAMEIYNYINSKNSVSDIYVPPLQKCELPGFSTRNTIEMNPSVIKTIPPLIKGYLRLGAKLSSEPALDKVFCTTDFFVLFDQKSITDRYSEKYF